MDTGLASSNTTSLWEAVALSHSAHSSYFWTVMSVGSTVHCFRLVHMPLASLPGPSRLLLRHVMLPGLPSVHT